MKDEKWKTELVRRAQTSRPFTLLGDWLSVFKTGKIGLARKIVKRKTRDDHKGKVMVFYHEQCPVSQPQP